MEIALALVWEDLGWALAPVLADGVTLTKSWAEQSGGTKMPSAKQGVISRPVLGAGYEVPIVWCGPESQLRAVTGFMKGGLFLSLHNSTAMLLPRGPLAPSSPASLFPAFAGATQGLVRGVLSGMSRGWVHDASIAPVQVDKAAEINDIPSHCNAHLLNNQFLGCFRSC